MPGRLVGFRNGGEAALQGGGFVRPGERGQIIRDGFGNGGQRRLPVLRAPGFEMIPVGPVGAEGVGSFGGAEEGAGLRLVVRKRFPRLQFGRLSGQSDFPALLFGCSPQNLPRNYTSREVRPINSCYRAYFLTDAALRVRPGDTTSPLRLHWHHMPRIPRFACVSGLFPAPAGTATVPRALRAAEKKTPAWVVFRGAAS